MVNVIVSLIIIVGGLVLGQVVKVLSVRNNKTLYDKLILIIRNIAFFVLSPFVVLNAFWIMDLSDIKIISVSFIGLLSLTIGMVFALVFSKISNHNRLDKGAMFCLGSSTNIGSIGALLCYTVFGEPGFVVCALYKLFELPFYYLFVYPVASSFSENRTNARKEWYVKLITDPIIQAYIGSIAVGVILNITGVVRFDILKPVNGILIPMSSFLLIVAVGYTMRFSKVSAYKREILFISMVKYIITPVFVLVISLLLGFHQADNLIIFKTLIILSALPCGFNSLIPVQMYKLNVDLANSCWLATTALLIIVFPIIWLLIVVT